MPDDDDGNDGDENGDIDESDENGVSRLRALRRNNNCCRYCFGMNGHSSVGKPDTQRFRTIFLIFQFFNYQIYNVNVCINMGKSGRVVCDRCDRL